MSSPPWLILGDPAECRAPLLPLQQAELILGDPATQPTSSSLLPAGGGHPPAADGGGSRAQPSLSDCIPGGGSSGERTEADASATPTASAGTSVDYLKQKLHYSEDGTKLLDADGGWGPGWGREPELRCSWRREVSLCMEVG